MIRMSMRNIKSIDIGEFFMIKMDLHSTLTEISHHKIRKPTIDKKSDIFSIFIFDIQEKLRMSERCKNHNI